MATETQPADPSPSGLPPGWGMRNVLSGLTIFLGILAIPACGYALFMMMGFGGLDLWTQGGMQVIALGLLGPLALLPAGILGRSRPRLAGLWLLAGGVGSALLYYGLVERDALWQLLYFRLMDWAPMLFGFIPLMILGSAFLAAGVRTPTTTPQPRVYWPLAFIVPSILACAGGVTDVRDLFIDHDWTMSVQPEGGEARRFRFDDRDLQHASMPAVFQSLEGFFRKPKARGSRMELGTVSILGPRDSGGVPAASMIRLEVGREADAEFDLLVLYRNGERWLVQHDNGLPLSVGISHLLGELEALMKQRLERLWATRR